MDADRVTCAGCHPKAPSRPADPRRVDGPLPPDWRRRITEATSWDDLYAILADAQVAYCAGGLTGEEVEGLAALCAQEAHALPEHFPEIE